MAASRTTFSAKFEASWSAVTGSERFAMNRQAVGSPMVVLHLPAKGDQTNWLTPQRQATHEPMRADSKTPLGVGMSIEGEAQRIVPQFPANFPLGNWQEIARRLSSGGGGSID